MAKPSQPKPSVVTSAQLPEEGSVTAFRYKTFSQVIKPLQSVMPMREIEREDFFGMETRAFSGQQFEKVAITNRYLDALLEIICAHQNAQELSRRKKEKLSKETESLLLSFENNANYEAQILKKIAHLEKTQPNTYKQIKDNFFDFYKQITSRGHHIDQVTRYAKNPEKATKTMIERGATQANEHEVYTLHPSIPVTLLSSSKEPLVSDQSLLRRDDHHVYTFAGHIATLLQNLKTVSPEHFWKPENESLITDESAPFVTAVEKNHEGTSLTQFIHLHPVKNQETIDIARGLEPINQDDLHQISVGLKDSVAIPDKSIEALGQIQNTGLEVKTGSLGEAMRRMKEAGIEFIDHPEANSHYYENIQKNLYLMFLPALLAEMKPHEDLDSILNVLSSYGFYIKTHPLAKGQTQPLLSKIEEMRSKLSSERKIELDLFLEKLLSFINYFHSYTGEMNESNITTLSYELASILQRVSLKNSPNQTRVEEFKNILSEILPRIREAKESGYFMEFVLKWDPQNRRISGGLLSQIFTLPLASKVTGRFTQWIELIEKACFRETTLKKGEDRGCSQFGGGSYSLSGTVNNFKQLIRGVTKAVEKTKNYPQLQLIPPSELEESPEIFLDKLINPHGNSVRPLLSIPEGVELTNTELRLVEFIKSLLHIATTTTETAPG
jgi:hypothetical protein